MPKMEELLRLVNEAGSRTARIQALAASIMNKEIRKKQYKRTVRELAKTKAVLDHALNEAIQNIIDAYGGPHKAFCIALQYHLMAASLLESSDSLPKIMG